MAVIGHSRACPNRAIPLRERYHRVMRYLWVFFFLLTGCSSESSNEPPSGTGWSEIKTFSPVVTLPRDGLFRLHYVMTGGAAILDADLDGDWTFSSQAPLVPNPHQTFGSKPAPLVFEDRTEGSGLTLFFRGGCHGR